jgi:ABC-type Zn uptake system ZnuABC Zn-binding protein ZnuA
MLNLGLMRLLWAIGIIYGLLAAPLVLAASAVEPLNVVVTIPVLKDLAEQVGGHHVRVTSLLSGYENEHTYSPKPSDLIAVRKARLLFEIGIGLEVWVSSLVKNAGSPSLRVVTTSKGIGLLRDRSDHDGAAQTAQEDERGNPQASYLRKLDQLRGDLSDRIARLSDRRFIAHHPAWPYFARRFGFQIVGTIQPQSGSEPSALQLHSLIAKIKKDRIKVVVSEIQLSQRIPDLLAKETSAHVVVLTTLPGGLPNTETYLDMLRYNVLQLANALDAA